MNKEIISALQEQAEHINGDTPLVLVEDSETALYGNLLYPENLWVQALPIDNLNFAEGLPKVVIFPSSQETAKLWQNRGIGKVLNRFFPSTQSLILKWLEDTAEEEKKQKEILKDEILFLTQNS